MAGERVSYYGHRDRGGIQESTYRGHADAARYSQYQRAARTDNRYDLNNRENRETRQQLNRDQQNNNFPQVDRRHSPVFRAAPDVLGPLTIDRNGTISHNPIDIGETRRRNGWQDDSRNNNHGFFDQRFGRRYDIPARPPIRNDHDWDDHNRGWDRWNNWGWNGWNTGRRDDYGFYGLLNYKFGRRGVHDYRDSFPGYTYNQGHFYYNNSPFDIWCDYGSNVAHFRGPDGRIYDIDIVKDQDGRYYCYDEYGRPTIEISVRVINQPVVYNDPPYDYDRSRYRRGQVGVVYRHDRWNRNVIANIGWGNGRWSGHADIDWRNGRWDLGGGIWRDGHRG